MCKSYVGRDQSVVLGAAQITNLANQAADELQSGLLQICAAHPEVRADIVALFRDLDAKHAAPPAKMIEHGDPPVSIAAKRMNGEVHADG